jgi:hypothetical protein
MTAYQKLADLRPEHFELMNHNGLLWVKDPDVLVALARKGIAELAEVPIPWPCRYPLTVRRTTYGVSRLLGSDELSARIRQEMFPAYQDAFKDILWSPNELTVRTADVIDPLIREGVLIMTKPAGEGEQDLYWPDDGWFIRNLKDRTIAHHP